MSFSVLVRINFFVTVMGTFVSIPIYVVYDMLFSNGSEKLFGYYGVDILLAMLIVPILVGFASAVTTVMAYPVIYFLKEKNSSLFRILFE